MRSAKAIYAELWRERHKDGFGPEIECGCGCGARFRQFDVSRHERRFLKGHHSKGKLAIGTCACGCGRQGYLVKGVINVCYQRSKRRDGDVPVDGGASLLVRSHWNDRERVILELPDGQRLVIHAAELQAAIEWATRR